ncbi:hypothetical protein [Xylanimonas ulmi]|uniref:Uncharacterized protein n=1 Tax=Xylanimonas ulmi TaxID=228973 RepID=A0A4Q7M1E0_9MICO|nr:hypothetical protein [Xylanibacterium ulmi]RZS61646.1 hypothetical protein EV386_1956 [Xylanibacterium ulmi]
MFDDLPAAEPATTARGERPHADPAALDPGREPGIDPALDPERGDVPGWVLVTLMTAGLVVALWAIAGPLLEDAFTQAISSVTGR